jgi:phosphate transport system substrate-binding protein
MLSPVLTVVVRWIGGHPEAFLTALGLVVAIVTWALDHRLRRPRLLYRVQMDTRLQLNPAIKQTVARIAVRANDKDVTEPSVVLLRLTNTGALPIRRADFVEPLSFGFKGRQVVGYEVAENDAVQKQLAGPPPPLAPPSKHRTWWWRRPEPVVVEDAPAERKLALPGFDLEPRQRFKLLVVLSGPGRGVEVVEGKQPLRNGKLVRDLGGNAPSRRTMVYGAIVAVLLGAVVMTFIPPLSHVETNGVTCVGGKLNVVGSTAFQPVVAEIAKDYEAACGGVTITVNGSGSIAGLSELEAAKKTDEVALYDGTAPAGSYPDLTGSPVAAIVYAVVVNWNTQAHNLTVHQLQDIFTGKVTNWSQLSPGLPTLPITVVGRDSESGTRSVFVDTVLSGTAEHDRTSQNCAALDPGQPAAAPVLCEMPNTDLVLQKVNSIPGAIGYAEVAASDTAQNIYRIQIQNHDPDILQNKQAAYPFWATEHVYTYGTPAHDSLLAAFLAFMNSKAEHDAMQKHGAIPCADLGQTANQAVCSG